METRGERDLAAEAVGAETGDQVWPQHLEGNPAAVLGVPHRVDCGHTAATHVPFDRIGVGREVLREAVDRRSCHLEFQSVDDCAPS
jgi:hypothetical protein